MFRIPSFPCVGSFDSVTSNIGELQPASAQFQHSDSQILGAYYRHIHPVFPILPPPVEEVTDNHSSGQSFVHSVASFSTQKASPLVLALSSVLRLSTTAFPPDADKESDGEVSHYLYQRAADLVESFCSSSSSVPLGTLLPSAFHPRVPSQLELPLACCVLSLYQYLRWGNISEMTRLAQKAHSILQGMSVEWEHDGPFAEAQRRAWWMSVSTADISSQRPRFNIFRCSACAYTTPVS
jgi:hypothetical protein